ncbi:MAG: MarR family transcriptional regulator [Acidobacteria bacterium]|nr:MarR family transcriptional regulator [Acidobacteriota bacterium]
MCLSDFAVLEALLHVGPQPVNELGRKVLLTSGSITTAVDRLAERGLVRRVGHPSDRRTRIVSLTSEGRSLIRAQFATHAHDLERAMHGLTATERRTLFGLLRKLEKSQ